MTYYMGVDGGGSTLRVVITTSELEQIAYIEKKSTSNPAIIGKEAATQLIQQGARDALTESSLSPDDITAVTLGISGGDSTHAREWLLGLLVPVLPNTKIIPSSDQEIALVGGNGERRGVLLLSGTGSVSLGINEAGDMARVGGWGYLIGDEGSGYWIGSQALRYILHTWDGRGEETALMDAVLAHLELASPVDLINWIYAHAGARNRDIAALAPLVMQTAKTGDNVALQIVEHGAEALYRHYLAIVKRLNMDNPKVTFAGGLLLAPTLLRNRLMAYLGMRHPPVPMYPPVMGAALLAKLLTE